LDGASAAGTSWKRYPETELFPHWVWMCSAAEDAPTDIKASLDDGTAGKLVAHPTWTFVPDGPAACLIDAVSGLRTPGKATVKGGKSAKDLLQKFPIAGCDQNTSRLAFKEATQ
jgi:hypothetical protein